MTVMRFVAYAALLCTVLVFSLHAQLYDWANDNLWITIPAALLTLFALERIVPGIENAEAHFER